MRLRNKKTGKIFEFDNIGFRKERSDGQEDFIVKGYSLTSLYEAWEDYEIKEPLIKDQKIRKAIRAWLAIQEQPIVEVSITCETDSDGFFNYCLYGHIDLLRKSNGFAFENKNLTAINFEFRSLKEIEFEDGRVYIIAELCGDEEE